jgi:hypothetical protein
MLQAIYILQAALNTWHRACYVPLFVATLDLENGYKATNHKTDCAKICYHARMRNLLLLPELAQKYGVTTINVAYEAKHADAEPTHRHPDTNKPYYTLPIALDVLIKNKVYLAYDDETDTIARPDYLIGVGNHWLQTLTDDHKNRRIDITQYTIRH